MLKLCLRISAGARHGLGELMERPRDAVRGIDHRIVERALLGIDRNVLESVLQAGDLGAERGVGARRPESRFDSLVCKVCCSVFSELNASSTLARIAD